MNEEAYPRQLGNGGTVRPLGRERIEGEKRDASAHGLDKPVREVRIDEEMAEFMTKLKCELGIETAVNKSR